MSSNDRFILNVGWFDEDYYDFIPEDAAGREYETVICRGYSNDKEEFVSTSDAFPLSDALNFIQSMAENPPARNMTIEELKLAYDELSEKANNLLP